MPEAIMVNPEELARQAREATNARRRAEIADAQATSPDKPAFSIDELAQALPELHGMDPDSSAALEIEHTYWVGHPEVASMQDLAAAMRHDEAIGAN